MLRRLFYLHIGLAALLSGCIFAPVSGESSDASIDSDATSDTDVMGSDVSDASFDADKDADDRDADVDQPPCADCVGTWAGTGLKGASGGEKLSAKFDDLADIVVDEASRSVYLADSTGQRIWKVEDGEVSSFAGTGSCGLSDSSAEDDDELCTPKGLALVATDDLYVAECDTNKVKRVDGDTIVHVAGSPDDRAPWEGNSREARLRCPTDLISTGDGPLFIAGNESHRIHELSGGELSILAGGDSGYEDGDDARFRLPTAIVHDPDEQRLIVVDRGNHCLRSVSLEEETRGRVETIAGQCETPGATEPGPATSALFNDLRDIHLDGRVLYVLDGSALHAIDFASAEVSVETVAGNQSASHHKDGPSRRAKLHDPHAMSPFVDSAGEDTLLITERSGHSVRKWKHIDPIDSWPALSGDGPTIETVAGTGFRESSRGAALESSFAEPADIVRYDDNRYLIADRFNHQILLYEDDEISVFAGTGQCGPADPEPVAKAEATFCQPVDLLVDHPAVYVVDWFNQQVRLIERGEVKTAIGSARFETRDWDDADYEGDALDVKLRFPEAVTMDDDGSLYIAGGQSHAIHKWNADDGRVQIYAGEADNAGHSDRRLDDSKFRDPSDIVFANGGFYVADADNHCVRRLEGDDVTTAFGSCEERGTRGGAAEDTLLDTPTGLLAVDRNGDSTNELIILDRVGVSISNSDGSELTRYGTDWEGWRTGPLDTVGVAQPASVIDEGDGSLLVTERDGDRIRRISF